MKKNASSCMPNDSGECCCRIESLVTVDERGQMVLPKELRDRVGIRPGDKLAVIGWERGKTLCCLTLVKVDEFSDMVKDFLGPIMKDIVTE
ncbi:MAG: HgcAB-associated protein HgcC [Candidatus Glassbacteria bacterium]